MTRRLIAPLFVATLAALVLVARAEPPAGAKAEPKKDGIDIKLPPKDDIKIDQAKIERDFKEFKNALLTLKQRLEKSDRLEDKEKAAILQKALIKIEQSQVDNKFAKLLEILQNDKAFSTTELEKVMRENQELAKEIRAILDILLTNDREAQLKREIAEYTRMLEKLKEVIRQQENARTWTERQMKNAGQAQKDVTGKTKDLIKGNVKGDGKGEAKPGDAKGDKKGGTGQGEAKNDTKDSKGDGKEGGDAKGEGKDGGKDGGKEGAQGKDGGKDGGKEGAQGKDGGKEGGKDGGQGKDGGKDGGKEGGQGKDGSQDGGKEGGQGKDGGKDGGKEGGQGKDGGKDGGKEGGQGKDGGKDGGKEGGQGKDGGKDGGKEGAQGKDGGQQGGKESKGGSKEAGKDGGKESKPGDGKQGGGDPKPGDGKGEGKQGGSDSKPGDAKGGAQGDSKGKGDGKGDGKGQPSDSKGGGQSGQGGQGQSKGGGQQGGGQQGGSKGDGQQGGQQGGNQQPQDNNPAKKKIQDANEYQEKAGDNIDKGQTKDATQNQGKAIDDLKEAQKKLEELLRQLRQEEIERVLAALQARCQKMLDMQIAVRHGTVDAHQQGEGKPLDQLEENLRRLIEQKANTLSEDEDKIVVEAGKAIQMLETEGSAVAFPEVFKQLRRDMSNVATRLRKTEVGVVTQAIEQDIIDTLKEMIEALKKARQENQQQGNKPPPQQGSGNPNDNQKLIDEIAELKMIRSLQIRVNNRTQTYGKEYPGEQVVPEQAKDNTERGKYEMIQRELKELAESQDKIFEITNNIARGKNK